MDSEGNTVTELLVSKNSQLPFLASFFGVARSQKNLRKSHVFLRYGYVMGFPQELSGFNSEPKRYKSVSLSAKRSASRNGVVTEKLRFRINIVSENETEN